LDRQLASAQAKHQDFEDAVLQIEREKASWVRQMESVRKQVEAETSRRTQVEQGAKLQHHEATQLKEQFAKLELEHKKTLDDLHQRDWEVSQLRSKQDKTIVEHVHVLEEAKRVTDRQLALAQQELKDLTAYVKSLEKAKTRLIGDAEDLTRQTERERLELKAKEKAAKAHEQLALRAKEDVENERKAREAAELRTRRAESELKNMQSQLADTQRQLETSKRSKAQLESELASLVNDGDIPNSADKIRRQYEAKITQLEQNNANAGHTRSNADRIRQHVEQQQIQLRRLIMTQMPKDDSFRTRLLRELEEFDKRLLQEFSHRPSTPGSEIRTLANVSPSKRSSMNGVARPRLSSLGENSHLVEAELGGLRQQIQTLEIQIVASDRVRQHLQAVLRNITADLDHTDGTKQSLQAYRAKLVQENARLKELLDEEADTRRVNESAQLDGVKALWTKFQHTISQEQASYAKLEDSRKALVGLTFHQRRTQ
jgi:myosin heavy chain 9/10/11/14